MAETATRLPVRDESRAEEKAPEPKTVGWPTFTDLRREEIGRAHV